MSFVLAPESRAKSPRQTDYDFLESALSLMTNENLRIHQSAVLAYRVQKKRMQVMMITSLDTGRWVIPKGHIEGGLSARASAEKEAFEEAGLLGQVSKVSIGHFDYHKTELKGGGHCSVQVFPMRVRRAVPKWPEKDLRRRKWMSPKKAAASVAEPQLRRIILKFCKTVPSKSA